MGLGAAGIATGKSLMLGGRAGLGFGLGMAGRTGMNSLSGKQESDGAWCEQPLNGRVKRISGVGSTGALGMKARRLYPEKHERKRRMKIMKRFLCDVP